MRTSMIAMAAVTWLACVACSTGFEKIPETDVDLAQKAKADALATRIYEGCKTGTHTALGEDEAIPEMREGLAPAKMPATCSALQGQFGDFQSLDYVETWKSGSGKLHVYRFKGHFSKSSTLPEIRVVMEGPKLSGFWIRPWADPMK